MQIEKISASLDWLHVRLPRVCRWVFAGWALMVGLGVAHLVATSTNAAYRSRVYAQYAEAELQRSVLALPLGQLVTNLGVLLLTAWVGLFLLRVVLALRARLWRRVSV